ncbi:MAG: hypothetical protein KGJ58_03885 [Patescibacteria group bacterium]|nr:hypothetical protein [Patescibacteria group bacterium]MDE2218564.1 hypothetical protein [Patescibacteria group bacterium]
MKNEIIDKNTETDQKQSELNSVSSSISNHISSGAKENDNLNEILSESLKICYLKFLSYNIITVKVENFNLFLLNMFKKTIAIFGLLAMFSVSNISLAQTNNTTITSSSSSIPSLNSSLSLGKKGIDLICVQTAVDTRENDLIAAKTTQGNTTVTAYEVRKSALHDAWGIADKIAKKKAIKAAWKTFNDSMKKINRDWRIARNSAWLKSEKASKACGGKISASEDAGNERSDQ